MKIQNPFCHLKFVYLQCSNNTSNQGEIKSFFMSLYCLLVWRYITSLLILYRWRSKKKKLVRFRLWKHGNFISTWISRLHISQAEQEWKIMQQAKNFYLVFFYREKCQYTEILEMSSKWLVHWYAIYKEMHVYTHAL